MSTTIHSKYKVVARLSTATDYSLPSAIFENGREVTDQNTKFRRMLIVSALPTEIQTYTIWESVDTVILSNAGGDDILCAYVSTARPDITDPLWPQINMVIVRDGEQLVLSDYDPRWNMYFLGGLNADVFIDVGFIGKELTTYIAPPLPI